MFRRNRGFTLIELLVVIAIIGILASVVLVSLNSARKKSRDARRISDVKQIQLAAELYLDGNNIYPASISDMAGSELPSEPLDPVTGANYSYERCASGHIYHLGASLEESGSTALNTDLDAVPTGCGGLDWGDDDGCSGQADRHCYDVSS